MITGVLRRIDSQWYLDYTYPNDHRPVIVGVRWKVTDIRRTGPMVGELTEGMTFQYQSLGPEHWRYYDRGDYWLAYTEKQGTILPELPVPCPKVKAGIETRWHNGQWQKYLKTKGWVAA